MISLAGDYFLLLMPSIFPAAFSSFRESLEIVFSTALASLEMAFATLFVSLDTALPMDRTSFPIVASVFRALDFTVEIAFLVPIFFVSIFGDCAFALTAIMDIKDIAANNAREFVFFIFLFSSFLLLRLIMRFWK